MTDAAADPAGTGSPDQPTAEQAALAAAGAVPPPPAASPVDERPELAVGAAFAGGLALALLLKRLAR